eukprot:752181-Hanusia_phi.AAC.1
MQTRGCIPSPSPAQLPHNQPTFDCLACHIQRIPCHPPGPWDVAGGRAFSAVVPLPRSLSHFLFQKRKPAHASRTASSLLHQRISFSDVRNGDSQEKSKGILGERPDPTALQEQTYEKESTGKGQRKGEKVQPWTGASP